MVVAPAGGWPDAASPALAGGPEPLELELVVTHLVDAAVIGSAGLPVVGGATPR